MVFGKKIDEWCLGKKLCDILVPPMNPYQESSTGDSPAMPGCQKALLSSLMECLEVQQRWKSKLGTEKDSQHQSTHWSLEGRGLEAC